MSFAVKPIFVTGNSLNGAQGAQGPTGAQGATGSLTSNVIFTRGTDISLITGNNDNYVISSGTLFIISSSGITPTITGIDGGTIGRYIIIVNAVVGLTNLNFTDEDTNSLASNRFCLNTSTTTISVNKSITFIYGVSTLGNRWILVSHT